MEEVTVTCLVFCAGGQSDGSLLIISLAEVLSC